MQPDSCPSFKAAEALPGARLNLPGARLNGPETLAGRTIFARELTLLGTVCPRREIRDVIENLCSPQAVPVLSSSSIAQSESTPQRGPPPMTTKMTLLVVDDDEDVLGALKTKLERTGRYDVFTATGGHEALLRVRERRHDLI